MVPWNPAKQAVAKGAICMEKHTHQEISRKKKQKTHNNTSNKLHQSHPKLFPPTSCWQITSVNNNHNNAELHLKKAITEHHALYFQTVDLCKINPIKFSIITVIIIIVISNISNILFITFTTTCNVDTPGIPIVYLCI